MNKDDLRDRLERLLPLVRQASELALSYFGKTHSHDKPDGSIVTEADALTERLLVDGLKSRFPGETIMGEELGCSEGDPRYVWSIDPIDGTAAYSTRLPFWCVSVGLFYERQPVLGVVSLPALDETYSAYRGGGAYWQSTRWGRERLSVHAEAGTSKLCPNSMICLPSNIHHRFNFNSPCKMRSLGSTAIHALLVARNDAISAVMSPYHWDIAGAVPILLEAGGQVGTYQGDPVDLLSLTPERKSQYIILGSPAYIAYTRDCMVPKNQ